MGGIITKEKVKRILEEIESCRGAIHNVRPSDLVSLAGSLGREKSKKGRHPTYESIIMPERNPLSIPGHPTIKPRTAKSILADLEADAQEILDRLEQRERNNDAKRLPQGTVHENPDS
jgi:hypothetical protein